jgi:hypothetical protein
MQSLRNLSIGAPRIKYILGLLIALVVSDGLMTDFLIRSGLGQEGNPFLEPIVSDGNILLIKIVGALLSALILWDIHRRRPNLALKTSLLFVICYTAIVYWGLAAFFISQV